GQSAVGQAARGKYPEMVRWLMEKGSTDAASALDFALETNDAAIAKLALGSGHLERLELLADQKYVQKPDSKVSPEMRALILASTAAAPPRKPFTADPKRLGVYARTYGGGNAPEATVTARDNGVAVAIKDQPELVVAAIAPDLFENAAGDTQVSF